MRDVMLALVGMAVGVLVVFAWQSDTARGVLLALSGIAFGASMMLAALY